MTTITPDPEIVAAIYNELSIHLFGEAEARHEMADRIARRLLRDCAAPHHLDVEVVAVIRSTLGPSVEVHAAPVDPDDGRRLDTSTVSWWTDASAAPPVGTKLRVEIREA